MKVKKNEIIVNSVTEMGEKLYSIGTWNLHIDKLPRLVSDVHLILYKEGKGTFVEIVQCRPVNVHLFYKKLRDVLPYGSISDILKYFINEADIIYPELDDEEVIKMGD